MRGVGRPCSCSLKFHKCVVVVLQDCLLRWPSLELELISSQFQPEINLAILLKDLGSDEVDALSWRLGSGRTRVRYLHHLPSIVSQMASLSAFQAAIAHITGKAWA